jgi:hypothetical protein
MDDPNLPKLPEALTPAEARQRARERMAAFLRDKWSPPVICPVCDNDTWTFGDPVDTAVRDPDIPAPGYPLPSYVLVPVFCDNCAYAMFFNAVTAGAVPSLWEMHEAIAEQLEETKKAVEERARAIEEAQQRVLDEFDEGSKP